MGLDETIAAQWVPEPLAPGALGAEPPTRLSPVAAAARLPEPPPADVAAAVEALLAAAQTPLEGVPGAQLLDRARGLARLKNVVAAELARTVAQAESVDAAYDDGLTGMRPWLRGHTAATGPEAGAVLAAGRSARRMPAVGAAAADGGISPGQVAVIDKVLTERVWDLGAAAGADLAALDLVVAETAVHAPAPWPRCARRSPTPSIPTGHHRPTPPRSADSG